ncbi:Uncharacterised protein [Vibrio cholerae]|nr:Uncharacterised protein [Vibrio cholerae]
MNSLLSKCCMVRTKSRSNKLPLNRPISKQT